MVELQTLVAPKWWKGVVLTLTLKALKPMQTQGGMVVVSKSKVTAEVCTGAPSLFLQTRLTSRMGVFIDIWSVISVSVKSRGTRIQLHAFNCSNISFQKNTYIPVSNMNMCTWIPLALHLNSASPSGLSAMVISALSISLQPSFRAFLCQLGTANALFLLLDTGV